MRLINWFKQFFIDCVRSSAWYKRDFTLAHEIGFERGQIYAINRISVLYLRQEGKTFDVRDNDGTPTLDTLEVTEIQLVQQALHHGVPVEYIYEGPLSHASQRH
jgi:hypothetical protein